MKFTHYIYIVTTALFTACQNEEIIRYVYSVGDADNAIVLSAGISEGSGSVTTRATRAGVEDNHTTPGHVLFYNGTKATLRIDGTWTGHGSDPYLVSQTTTATIGEETATDSKHNSLSMSPQLYWDDYGTADPANASTGRTTGLTIYGAAVDGESTAPTVSDWTALSWTLDADQTSGWSTKDLLTSNNIKGNDNTYTFANATASPKTNNLLEFTHAMTKITVNLTAAEGFPVANSDPQFQNEPTISLLNFNYTGSVNVETKVSTPTASSITNINAHREGDATWAKAKTVQFTALVFPGNQFADATDIIKINCDGNIYYVNATKINEANTETNNKFEQGKNYIFNIKVNKTKIEVTATIKNWVDVTADEVAPVINVSASYGDGTGTALTKDNFSFYRSTSFDNGYSKDYSGNANNYFAAESQVNKPNSGTTWTFTNPLYWSDHNTHYQMRGVWPLTTTATDATTSPRVENSTHDGTEYQVIKVSNVAYEQNSFPSDLAIGRPNVATDATCSNSETGHTKTNLYSGGICATEGTINLEFEYMMSQVEVNLSTTTGDDKIELKNAKVEVTNLYTAGEIKLGDREVFLTGDASTYPLHTTSTANQFRDAIAPQTLTFTVAGASTNVRFKITITNNDAVLYTAEDAEVVAGTKNVGDIKTPATQDIYYADVAPILKSGSTTEKVAPNGKWEHGVHYVYNLKLSKTKIDVTAVFKDWVTVSASDNVWF